MDVDPTVPVVKSMLLLDSEGKRIAVKYYAPEWYVHIRATSPSGTCLKAFSTCSLHACSPGSWLAGPR